MSEYEYEEGTEPETIEMGGEQEGEEWQGPSQEEWQSAMQFQERAMPVLENLGHILSAPVEGNYEGEGQEYAQQQEEFDPFDAESVQRYIADQVQQGVHSALGPFEGVLGTVAAREGETLARNELERIEQESGAFDKDTAFLVASGLIEQNVDPTVALERGASYARDLEARIRQNERESYRQELEKIAGAPQQREMGSASATDGVSVPTGPDRYRIAIERALGNNHPVIPAG